MPFSGKIITEIPDRKVFRSLLESNPGLIILKFGANWCKPCEKIQPYVDEFFNTSPEHVLCATLDVDTSFELYSYFKYNKIVNGIPVLMSFYKGNTSGRPDNTVTGADLNRLHEFFKKCGNKAKELENA